MKSEERHEMETNVLAKFIVSTSEKVRPYTSYIVYGLLAVVAAWAIWSLSARGLGGRDQAAWDAYASATLPGKLEAENLKQTADEYAGRPVGELARIMWADRQLTEACFAYFSNKSASRERLEDAEQAYRTLLSGARDRAIRERAQFGIARVLEVRGEIDEAIEAYKKVTGSFSELATARVEELEKFKPVVDPTWLASAEGPALPAAVGSGARPPFRADDLQLPGGDAGAPTGPEETGDFLEMLNRLQSQLPEQQGPDRYEAPDATGSQPGLGGLDLDLTLPGEEAMETPPVEPAPEQVPPAEPESAETDPEDAPPESAAPSDAEPDEAESPPDEE